MPFGTGIPCRIFCQQSMKSFSIFTGTVCSCLDFERHDRAKSLPLCTLLLKKRPVLDQSSTGLGPVRSSVDLLPQIRSSVQAGPVQSGPGPMNTPVNKAMLHDMYNDKNSIRVSV